MTLGMGSETGDAQVTEWSKEGSAGASGKLVVTVEEEAGCEKVRH